MNTEHRYIVHLDLDAFFVSVECLRNSALRGKPLIVGGSGDRGVVAACSYEARKFGIHSAMPVKLAKRLCPEAIIISGDMEAYSQYSRTVTDIISATVPVYEKSSIDEFYIDLTGMDRYFGCGVFAAQLRRSITKETGLPISYALSSNKLISKVATNEVKPNGQLEIPFGAEKNYLAPLHVAKLPGVGKETATILRQMGVETVQTLSEIPPVLLQNLLGKSGADLWRKAQGIDDSPVVPYREQKSISSEETFSTDTIDTVFLQRELVRLTEKTAFELRQQNKLTGCITVKLRYANFDTVTRQLAVAYTNADHMLIPIVKELFQRLYDKRLLIRLIGVRFTQLIPGNYQINLFNDKPTMIELYQALDSLKGQFGVSIIGHAGGHSSLSKTIQRERKRYKF